MMAFLDTLDITEHTEMYDKLVDVINKKVLETQSFSEYRPLPSILLMTKKQHKMLRRYPTMKSMYGTTQKYWLSPHNIMECVIRDNRE